MPLQIRGFTPVVENTVYCAEQGVAPVPHPDERYLVTLQRFARPAADAIVKYLQGKAAEVTAAFQHATESGESIGLTGIDYLIMQLPGALRVGLAQRAQEAAGVVRKKISRDILPIPKNVLSLHGGTISARHMPQPPQQWEWYNVTMNFLWKASMRLNRDGTLPSFSIVDSVFTEERYAHDISTFLHALYDAHPSRDDLLVVPDVSPHVVQQIAGRTLKEIVGEGSGQDQPKNVFASGAFCGEEVAATATRN